MAVVVGLSGTLHAPSRTDRLLEAILARVEDRTGAETRVVSVFELRHEIIDALTAAPAAPLADAYEAVIGADALVVATPVYKGSYTGLLKAFVDPLDQEALADRPVLLAAVGGDAQHTLVIDHELKPLFGFFGAAVTSRGVYARGADFVDGALSDRLRAEVDAGAERLAVALGRT
jgi:FMN reductase